MKQQEYKLLGDYNVSRKNFESAKDELQSKVNTFLQNGWEVAGGISIAVDEYGLYTLLQAVVKTEE